MSFDPVMREVGEVLGAVMAIKVLGVDDVRVVVEVAGP
ncbi:MAG: hypothetical protein JWL73_698 [Actinomycetia bacterium]|nr:hypothetical protein [Actinomycetes bacterium]